jgi:biotin carboxyl carrier protein
VTEETTGRRPAQALADEAVDLDVLTGEVLPALIARLRASRLAELEVREGGWRVRLRRDLRSGRRASRGHAREGQGPAEEGDGAGEARSPAVGYFSPARDLAVGQGVSAGDTLGSVDVLGIAQEVTAPIDGIVSAVLAETGQAVEYGQVLAEIDPLGGELEAAAGEAAGHSADSGVVAS